MPFAPHPIMMFRTPAEFFNGLFGPLQHDAHVLTRHQHLVLADRRAQTDGAAERALAAVLAEMRREVPTDAACLEVGAYMRRPRHLRRVA